MEIQNPDILDYLEGGWPDGMDQQYAGLSLMKALKRVVALKFDKEHTDYVHDHYFKTSEMRDAIMRQKQDGAEYLLEKKNDLDDR